MAVIDESSRWDPDALKSGAAVSLVFAIPFAIGARWAADSRHDDTLALWFSIGALIGFVLGAGCAAWVQRVGLPLTHGLVTAIGTYVGAQAVFITIKLLRGGDVNWFASFFTMSAVTGAGLLGGLLGKHLHAKGVRPSGTEQQ